MDYKKGSLEDPVRGVINITDEFNNRVDLLTGIQGMTDDVFNRTIKARFMNADIAIVGLEDFIAMKIFTGSQKDLNDVVAVMEVSFEKINMDLLTFISQSIQKI